MSKMTSISEMRVYFKDFWFEIFFFLILELSFDSYFRLERNI